MTTYLSDLIKIYDNSASLLNSGKSMFTETKARYLQARMLRYLFFCLFSSSQDWDVDELVGVIRLIS